MAILIDIEEIPPTVRRNPFSVTITASSDALEVIESVTATLQGNSEPEIIIVNGETSVDISGRYGSKFNDVINYIEPGSNDNEETPTTVIGFGNMPSGKCIISFIQDTAQKVTATYDVVVTHDLGVDNFTVTHDILNDWVSPGQQLKDYIDNYASSIA